MENTISVPVILSEKFDIINGYEAKITTEEYLVKGINGKYERKRRTVKTIYRNRPKTMVTEKIEKELTSYQRWCENVYEVAEGCCEALAKVSKAKIKVAQISMLITSILATPTVHAYAQQVGATSITSGLKELFDILMNIALSIGEPILWFYALTALIMMATGKNKHIGKDRLKMVFYSYVMVRMLPTFFMFLGWLTDTVQESLKSAINIKNGGLLP